MTLADLIRPKRRLSRLLQLKPGAEETTGEQLRS
jgi:hypothetical protein